MTILFFLVPLRIPTLVRADLVVEAWERVRERVDGTQVDEQVLREQYGPRVCASATESFRDLVPLPAGERELFPALHGSVYPCLATHYYCPPSVESVDYLATICHDPVLLADSSPGARFACAAVCNYMEYRLEDERKGIWLERPGVPIIEPGWVAREREGAAGHAVIEVEFDEEEIAALDEIRQQMGFGFAAVRMTDRGENEGDAAPGGAAGTLHLSMCLRNQGLSPVLYEFIRRGLKHLRGSVAEFVTVCLREEMLEGLKLQQPFETMASSELRAGDPPQVTRQRPHE